jgi:hypothetical protein
MAENHRCTLYCEGDVHAMLVTAPAGVTRATIERFAVWQGHVVHEARRVLEADLATQLAKRKWTWDPATEALTPFLPTHAQPTDEVWMVRVSLARREGESSAPGPALHRGWWQRFLTWRRRARG